MLLSRVVVYKYRNTLSRSFNHNGTFTDHVMPVMRSFRRSKLSCIHHHIVYCDIYLLCNALGNGIAGLKSLNLLRWQLKSKPSGAREDGRKVGGVAGRGE